MDSILSFFPSMPKKMAVDILVILCILVLIIGAGLLFFIGGLHEEFITPVVTPPPEKELPLSVEIQMLSEVTQGESTPLNVTLINLGDSAVNEVVITIPSSENIEYSQENIGDIPVRGTLKETIDLKIKENAKPGEAQAKILVDSETYATTRNFTINIVQ